MANQEETLRNAVRRYVATLDGDARRTLKRQAGFDRMREAALRTERTVLARRLGEDAPEVRAVEQRLATAESQAARTFKNLRIAELGEKIQPEDAVVLGQVTHPQGSPAAGLEVTLTDERGPEAFALARALTDSAGFYFLAVPHREFKRGFKKSESLTLFVTGKAMEGQHYQVQPVGDLEQRLRLIDIRLPAEATSPPPKPAKKKPAQKPPKKKAVKKKAARKPAKKAAAKKKPAVKKKAAKKKAAAKKGTGPN